MTIAGKLDQQKNVYLFEVSPDSVALALNTFGVDVYWLFSFVDSSYFMLMYGPLMLKYAHFIRPYVVLFPLVSSVHEDSLLC